MGFARLFGLPYERCRAGIPIAEAFSSIHPDDVDRVASDIQEAMGRGGAFRCKYRVRQDDGCCRWIEANGGAELNADAKAVRFPGFLINNESRRAAHAVELPSRLRSGLIHIPVHLSPSHLQPLEIPKLPMDANNLYVAMTRGARKLVICSETPVLTPRR